MSVKFETRIGPGFWTHPTFEGMHFPAGEAHVKVINENDHKGELTEVATLKGADGNDLMLLAAWADAVWARGGRSVLIAPYLPGARQDKDLDSTAYRDFFDGLTLEQIIVFDPHSQAAVNYYWNPKLTVLHSAPIVRKIVGRVDSDEKAPNYHGLICPDEGAIERTKRIASAVHLPIYYARKKRNPDTGKLSGFECDPLPDTGKFLVVDDICDGGGTFRGLAEVTGLPKERLGLYVSHGVFSGLAPNLFDDFGHIYTTNSYPAQWNLNPPANLFTEFDIDPLLKEAIQ